MTTRPGPKDVRWGILSTGQIAREFADGLRRSRHGALVAVASRDADTAHAFAADFHAEHAHRSYDDLLADADVDAVYIATPHSLHARWAIAAAEAGKHVLCEKPLAVNHPQAMAVVQAARDHGVFLAEAFMYRFHPQTERLVELVREQAIGHLRLIRATFSFDRQPFDPEHRLFSNELAGGAILDIGGYAVSLARLLAGSEPLSVQGAGRLSEVTGVDELAIGSLLFEDDILAQVACGVSLRVPDAIELLGTEGRIRVDEPAWLPRFRSGGATELVVERYGEPPLQVTLDDPGPSFAIEADTVARFSDRGEAPQVPLDDSLGNMHALDRWRRSVGLTYESERLRPGRITVSGRPLRRRSDDRMPYERLDGVPRPMSKLVMGVDNQPSDAHAAVMFDDFFERGGNAFDTAWMYGAELCCGEDCENRLGRWIEARGLRDEVVIVNKGAHSPYCFPGAVRPQLLESLRRLRTDHVELYMLHRDNPEVPADEFIDALNQVCEEGLVGVFGASNWTRERFDEAQDHARAAGLRGFSVLSNQFSLAAEMVEPVWPGVLSASDGDWRRWLTEHHIPLLAWSTLARGFLAGRDAASQHDPEVSRAWHSERNFQRLDRLEQLAAERGVPPASVAIAYVLHQPFPTFALIGPRTLAEARQSMAALDVSLSQDDVSFLAGEIDNELARV